MRSALTNTVKVLVLAVLLLPSRAGAEIIYARPDTDDAGAKYLWQQEIITDAISFKDAVAAAKGIDGSRRVEIRLLHRAGSDETRYSVAPASKRSALQWHGSDANKLVIRGQMDRSQSVPRPLTTFVGRSLQTVLCRPAGVELCDPSQVGMTGARRDNLDELAAELDRAPTGGVEAGEDVYYRLPCLFLFESSFVELVALGFRDCWLAAVALYGSANVTLRDSSIDGSTYAFLTVGKPGAPETAHSFEVTGNVWRQSPSSFRQKAQGCDIHGDWDCPVSVWSDIPWGITHHYFWSPLNGALFGAKDILGNVRIANNFIGDAYNGIRSKVSDGCLADSHCRQNVNIGFEITGNVFDRVRDNPIEPEGRAVFWVIKQNTFLNVYAAVSADGVTGHDFLVFGNIFALDEIPDTSCPDGQWAGSRQFRYRQNVWNKEAAEGDDARCTTHRMGTIFKFGSVDDVVLDAPPLLDRIFFFNNSVRTRSPLFRGTPAPPVTSYNNAVQFTGCAATGAEACRQQPDSDSSCAGKHIWTRDSQALYAECFPTHDGANRAIPHRMAFNAYNHAPGADIDAFDIDRVNAKVEFAGRIDAADQRRAEKVFAIGPASPLAHAGCRLRYANGGLNCARARGSVGAMLPTGRRFDLELPFRFPFDAALQRLNAPGASR